MREEATPKNIRDLKRTISNIGPNGNFKEIEQVETVLELLSDIVANQTVIVADQQTAFLEVIEDLGEHGQSLDEDWFNDDFPTWKNNNSNAWFN